ncbi:hypothetical protein BH23CHL5_BH23CHL5_21120 [soil metagenome]
MSREETQATIDAYLEHLLSDGSYEDFFAEDIVVSMMDVGREVKGRDSTREAVEYLHEVAFDAASELVTIIYEEGIASAEVIFIAIQIGKFAGVQPTGAEVRVPYSVVWELKNGQITALRLYQLASGLTEQVSAFSEAVAH